MRLALSLSPQDPTIISKFAPILEKNGDFNGAMEQYRLAAEIGKTDEAAKTICGSNGKIERQI